VHPGLVPGGTVSLRFGEKFLRHRCGKLEFLGEDVERGGSVSRFQGMGSSDNIGVKSLHL